MLAFQSRLLTDIADQLHEDSRKVNSVERLTRHLSKGTPINLLKSYLAYIGKCVPDEPVIHIDDSNIVKLGGYKFEALGIVRDGSKSTAAKSVFARGYHLTETCVLTAGSHPVSIFSEIHSKEDVIKVAKTYFSKWRIEGYFRCKKQMFRLENFRVRKLAAINALNFYITLYMAFLAHKSMKPETNALKVSIIKAASPIKEKVYFCCYRLAKGICGILSYTKEGVRLWFRTKRPAYCQLRLKLTA